MTAPLLRKYQDKLRVPAAAILLGVLLSPPLNAHAEDAPKEIRQAVCPYLGNSNCLSDELLTVTLVRIFKDYAMVRIARRDGEGEAEVGYLRRDGGKWVLIVDGTGVNPIDFGIPHELWGN
jgi:hypothetical protein